MEDEGEVGFARYETHVIFRMRETNLVGIYHNEGVEEACEDKGKCESGGNLWGDREMLVSRNVGLQDVGMWCIINMNK